jgi:N-acetylglucosaminyldiphosphoundecaprenol N-acetyl-beta-D-mannosaminyltransferase
MALQISEPPKRNVLNVAVSRTSYSELAEVCRGWIANRRHGAGEAKARYVCFLSVHGIITARDDREVGAILNAADVVAPDGMPVVWALRSFGFRRQERVYGPTAMLRLCEDAAQQGHRVFLYGGTEESLQRLGARLTAWFSGLQIVGAYSPPFCPLTEEEDERVVRRILRSDADIVFVGISTPKQERWMYSHRDRLPGVILAGVGAAFDFHAGKVRQAPPWVQKHGLEWLFRLLAEPRRLWHRYLVVTPRFLPLWALQWLACRIHGVTCQELTTKR